MSTRATYEFAMKGLPTLTFYIHHDGYAEGAAYYFWQMHHCKRHGTLAEKFLIANDRAELTKSHEYHGDTEYRYSFDGDVLVASDRNYAGWNIFFVGPWWEFVNKYRNEFCGTDFSNLHPVKDVTIYGNGARVVFSRKQLVDILDAKLKYAAEYEAKHPQWTGNIESAKADAVRAGDNLKAYDAINNAHTGEQA